MFNSGRRLLVTVITLCLLLLAAPTTRAEGTGTVTVMLNALADSLQESLLKAINPDAVIAVNDIYSFTLTVTQVAFKQYDNSDSKIVGGSSVVVFDGEQEVDLVNLAGISQILSTAEIPAGPYSKILMDVENPRLVLKANPSNVIQRVKITGNGTLFIRDAFEIPAGEQSLIQLTLNNFHLVKRGRGGDRGGGNRYVLNPKVSANVTVVSADVTVSGEIASVRANKKRFVLSTDNGDVTVLYAGTTVYLPTDTTTPTGTEANLTIGASAEVIGTIDLSGTVTATEIHLN